jgi:hypothetical protein
MVTREQVDSIRAMLHARSLYLLTGEVPSEERIDEMWDDMERAFGIFGKYGPTCERVRARVFYYLALEKQREEEREEDPYYFVMPALFPDDELTYN